MNEDVLNNYVISNDGESTRMLYDVIMDFNAGRIITAPFQRDFVWPDPKIAGWAGSMVNKKSIGVIVTYQLQQGSPIYLADGLQRINASKRFIETPSKFGFDFGSKQAEEYTRSFRIQIQHRIYKSHEEALSAFQDINNGTMLLSGEYFKGELCLSENGKYIYDKIPMIVERFESRYTSLTKNKERNNKRLRDSLALYYQYVTNHKGAYFWDAVSKKIYNVQVIERLVKDYVITKTIDELERETESFERFLTNHFAHIDELREQSNMQGRKISYSTLRWMIHFHIWCNNNNKTFSVYDSMMHNIFERISQYATATSSINYKTDKGEETYNFTISSLKVLDRLADILGVPEFKENNKRIKNIETLPGWHEHHPEPFSKYGNGKTVAISALRNMSIGNKEMALEAE